MRVLHPMKPAVVGARYGKCLAVRPGAVAGGNGTNFGFWAPTRYVDVDASPSKGWCVRPSWATEAGRARRVK